MNLADTLNLECACSTLQPALLRGALEPATPLRGLGEDILASRPHLFSASPVFLRLQDAECIAASVAALERVARLPALREAALARAPAIAAADPGASGVFMGYDFHISPDGPRLIEVNTNAGGAWLHAAALQAHRGCCGSADRMLAGALLPAELETRFLDMFRAEWTAVRGEASLRTIAIVDDAPDAQYLAPEFALARELFLRHGITAVVADASALAWRDARLWHGDTAIDLVYNRLTDFYLAEPRHEALRLACEAGAVVLTPHPHAHAVHAEKRNLIAFADAQLLARAGAAAADRDLLRQVVPATVLVTAQNADGLWERRRQLFFKPVAGYGSKAAYRGDKLTRRVWDEIRAGGFVAQALVPPSERVVPHAGGTTRLRLDVRAYAYRGRVLLLAARTYAGQTTNFRTPGGGFAPVVVVPSPENET